MQFNHQVNPVSLSAALSREFPDLGQEALKKYLAEIARWNSTLGLVSKRSTKASVMRLVRQSVGLWEFLANERCRSPHLLPERVVDIGSGAGFPGIIWKLLRPEITVALVERREKKVLFLQRVQTILQLEGIEVIAGDATELVKRQMVRGVFDVAVTMAVGHPAALATTVEGLLSDAGHYCTIRPRDEEIPRRIGARLELVGTSPTEFGRYCLYRM